ncbi:MAG: zinc-dependent alcohol dehydrogenase [Candidatus Zipacnadales bacterium]
MRAIYLFGPRDARLVDIEKPQISPNEALIKVECCVLCGSDVHQWDGRHAPVQYPAPFGHETAGTIIEVGREVTGLSRGDRVTWYLAHGSLCDYFAIRPEEMAVGKLATHLTWEEGANVQLVCAVMRGVINAEPGPGKRALVLGCGAVGLSVIQGALAMGCDEVVAADLIAFRREVALQLGAVATVDPSQPDWHRDLAPNGSAFDIVFDCLDEDRSPHGDTLDLALSMLKPRGVCSIIGLSSVPRKLDTSRIVYQGLRIVGAHHRDIQQCRWIMALCCQWVADGTIRVAPYITSSFRDRADPGGSSACCLPGDRCAQGRHLPQFSVGGTVFPAAETAS